MKALKDPDRVLRVMDAKLDELHESRKRFPMLPGKKSRRFTGRKPRSSTSRCTFAAQSSAMAASGWKTWRMSMNTLTALKKEPTSTTIIPWSLGSQRVSPRAAHGRAWGSKLGWNNNHDKWR